MTTEEQIIIYEALFPCKDLVEISRIFINNNLPSDSTYLFELHEIRTRSHLHHVFYYTISGYIVYIHMRWETSLTRYDLLTYYFKTWYILV